MAENLRSRSGDRRHAGRVILADDSLLRSRHRENLRRSNSRTHFLRQEEVVVPRDDGTHDTPLQNLDEQLGGEQHAGEFGFDFLPLLANKIR